MFPGLSPLMTPQTTHRSFSEPTMDTSRTGKLKGRSLKKQETENPPIVISLSTSAIDSSKSSFFSKMLKKFKSKKRDSDNPDKQINLTFALHSFNKINESNQIEQKNEEEDFPLFHKQIATFIFGKEVEQVQQLEVFDFFKEAIEQQKGFACLVDLIKNHDGRAEIRFFDKEEYLALEFIEHIISIDRSGDKELNFRQVAFAYNLFISANTLLQTICDSLIFMKDEEKLNSLDFIRYFLATFKSSLLSDSILTDLKDLDRNVDCFFNQEMRLIKKEIKQACVEINQSEILILLQKTNLNDKGYLSRLKKFSLTKLIKQHEKGLSVVETLAQDFKCLERFYFKQIPYSEICLIHSDLPYIKQYAQYFNAVSQFIVEQILQINDHHERIKAFQFFIELAGELKIIGSNNSAFAIIAAFNNVSISRLSNTWESINLAHVQLKQELDNFFDTSKNWKNYSSAKLKWRPDNKEEFIPLFNQYLGQLKAIYENSPHYKREKLNWQKLVLVSNIQFEVYKYHSKTLDQFTCSYNLYEFIQGLMQTDYDKWNEAMYNRSWNLQHRRGTIKVSI